MPDGLSAAMRANLTALQKIASDISREQNRLATGRQVNSPSDNPAAHVPAAHVTASSLNARAAALNSVLDGIGNGKRTIEAATGGLENIRSLVGNMRSLADQALSSPSTLAKVTGSVSGLTVGTVVSLDNGETITVSDGTTTAVYSRALGRDVQALVNAVNTTANLNVRANLTGDGRIQLEATGVDGVIIGGSASVGALSAIGLSAGTTTSTSNSSRQALAQQFDAVRAQIDQLAADAGFNGQNLLAGSTLVIGLNDTGDAAATISGSAVTAASLGIGVASGAGGDFQFDGGIEELIADLDLASASLQQMSSSYSEQLSAISVRENFTKGVSNLLSDGAERLVETEINEEVATLLALQTRRDLASTSLPLAAESDKAMLRLFGSS
jgi:flagellin